MPRRNRDSRRYGNEHVRARKAMLPNAPGSPCTRCGITIQPGDKVDLDHTDDGSGYLGFAHSRCNRQAGARKGNAERNKPRTSRDW